MKKRTPRISIGKFIEPTRVFIAILLVVAFWLAPVMFAPKEKQETNIPHVVEQIIIDVVYP